MRLVEKREEEEHRQLRSILRLTQEQKPLKLPDWLKVFQEKLDRVIGRNHSPAVQQ